jgi:hypothetical protein
MKSAPDLSEEEICHVQKPQDSGFLTCHFSTGGSVDSRTFQSEF